MFNYQKWLPKVLSKHSFSEKYLYISPKSVLFLYVIISYIHIASHELVFNIINAVPFHFFVKHLYIFTICTLLIIKCIGDFMFAMQKIKKKDDIGVITYAIHLYLNLYIIGYNII